MTGHAARYCTRCGTELGTKHVDGRDRRYCAACDRVEWRNPVPGAGVAVVDPERGVLLAQRDIEPGVGEWVVPGGYMEVEETPAVAGTRELEEETGVSVDADVVELLGTFTATPFDGKHIVSIGYVVHARHATGTPRAGHEVQAVDWFTPEAFAASDHVFHEPHDERFARAWAAVAGD